ncbi:MAG: M4 family metallopeptidase [Pricia sp.]
MKKVLLLFFLFGSIGLKAQSTFADKKRDNAPAKVTVDTSLITYPKVDVTKRKSANLANKGNVPLRAGLSSAVFNDGYSHTQVVKGTNGVPVFMRSEAKSETAKLTARLGTNQIAGVYLKNISGMLRIEDAATEFSSVSTESDDLGQTHIKMQQVFKGVPVYGSEVAVHLDKKNQVRVFNGRSRPTPKLDDVRPSFSDQKAIAMAAADLGINPEKLPAVTAEFNTMADLSPKSELVIYSKETVDIPKLTWHLTVFANGMERWEYFVDAKSGAIVDKYNHTCHFNAIDPVGGYDATHDSHLHGAGVDNDGTHRDVLGSPVLETNERYRDFTVAPPETAVATDLNGVNQSINTYSLDGTHYMIDVSRPMFDAGRSEFPNNTVGVIQTWDFRNQPVDTESPKYYHNTSASGNWNNPTAVSAQYNAQVSYEYFRTTFNRNSINGQGGSIISVINIADEDGGGFENAFWNGQFMAYGNGRTAFRSFAGALDVGGHEMSHGVIGNTANLTYQGESGAINESFADIFGTMIDRDDWLLAEDIVNTNVYTSGAMRSMQDPHNGGNALGDIGWQPNNVSEQYSGSQDNGGVHINSGIANYAFYLFATASAVGKDKAEQVYYRALTTYLTASSQFVDLRLAVLQSASDIHGENSPEVRAAQAAFDAVGILDGASTPTDDTLPGVSGEDFILSYDLRSDDPNTLYISDTQPTDYTPITSTVVAQVPSVAGDGSFVIFVTDDNTVNAITLSGDYPEEVISPEPIWGGVALSRDGTKLATFFNDETARVFILDLVNNTNQEFELNNPTTAEGVRTGDVLYPDAIEWDPTGQYLMYDALNSIGNDAGDDFEYWDVGFIKVWDNQTNTFGDGTIQKLFTNLPEGVSIGNPTFAKTSANVVAFDLLDTSDPGENRYEVIAANIETGDVKTVWNNTKLGFPNYSKNDDRLLFDGTSANSGAETVNVIAMENDRITASGDATVLIPDGKWGIWFTVSDGQAPPDTNDDQDADGVPDGQDQCADTPAGTVVDANGCPTGSLPADQFSVRTAGESCASSNDGIILVTAKTEGNYTATLTGNGINGTEAFTSSIGVTDMQAGTYTVCITAAGVAGYENCFDVVVDEPQPLSVTSKIASDGKAVTLNLTGGKTYTIEIGGATFTTLDESITLPLNPSATKLSVRTDKDCQGVYEERFNLTDKVIIYPNPVASGAITVVLEETPTVPVQVQLSSPDGKVVFQNVVEPDSRSIQIDADALVAGMYVLTLSVDKETSTYKIIKR